MKIQAESLTKIYIQGEKRIYALNELSVSIGTCEVTDWKGIADCMKKADKAMYLEKKAKKKGR